MSENTKIQWATHTWSPWIGCSKVHTGCLNCYAERDFAIRRKRVTWGTGGTRVKTSAAYWKRPLKWNRETANNWEHPRVFPSLCDPFERVGKADPCGDDYLSAWRREMFALIAATPKLDWLLLTKRPENIVSMWPGGYHRNVWLIYSASDQDSLEAGLPHLLKCRDLVPVLGVSLEPLIGPVDLDDCWPGGMPCPGSGPYVPGLDWVIVGGESGPKARPCDRQWIFDVAEACSTARVPCFIKQLGARSVYCGDRYPLRDSKGGDTDEWPNCMRVRQFPAAVRNPAEEQG